MAGSRTFDGVFEGDDIERFVGRFVLAGAERDRKIAADPGAGWERLPSSTEQALWDLKEVWAEHGLLTPAETSLKLMEKYVAGAPPALSLLLKELHEAQDAPEKTTGYLGKEHAYTATGLAHLYARETGKTTLMVEVDFSNMGGTNDYFRDKLAAERGMAPDKVPPAEYMAMTDMAMRVLCQSMTDTMRNELPAGARIIPIRTGGDELRLIVSGNFKPEQMAGIADTLHANIEKHVAAMGLQDHPHLKAPEDNTRNGFGAALAVQDMNDIHDTTHLIQELDGVIKVAKQELGLARLGKIDLVAQAAEIYIQMRDGQLKAPDGVTPEKFAGDELLRREQQAQKASAYLRGLNPQHNPALDNSVAGFLKYVADHTVQEKKISPVAAFMDEGRPMRVEDSALMLTLQERREWLAEKVWSDSNVFLTAPQQFMSALAIAGMTATDPSARVFMPQVLGPTVEAFADDMEAFRRLHDPAKPAVAAACREAGMAPADIGKPFAMAVSFHNLGGLNNLLGHHHSDIVLREMGMIIDRALEAAGLPKQKSGQPWITAHNGGACFTVLVKPGVQMPDGSVKFICEQHIKAASDEIRKGIEALNHTDIVGFFEKQGVEVGQAFRAMLEKEGASSFADVKDPKKRKTDIDGAAITGRVPGLRVAVSHRPVPESAVGGGEKFISSLRESCDNRIEQLRRREIVQAHVADVVEKTVPSVIPRGAHPALEKPGMKHVLCVYHRLPSEVSPGMSPELQSLVEYKRNAAALRAEIVKTPPRQPQREQLQAKYETCMHEFCRQFDDLAQGGGLLQVAGYFANSQHRAAQLDNTQNMKLPTPATKFGDRKPGGGTIG